MVMTLIYIVVRLIMILNIRKVLIIVRIMLMPVVLQLSSLTIRDLLNQKVLHYSVLESSLYQLLNSEIKNEVFHIKKSM